MEIKYFEEHIGVPVEEFLDVITRGFYYIDQKCKEIYWHGNDSIYVGNGWSNKMVIVYPLWQAGDKEVKDGHYWDWKKEGSVFDFKNYNKTWSFHREILEEILRKES